MALGRISAMGKAALFAAILAMPAWAETIRKPADGVPLQTVLDRASEGDVIILEEGEHKGPVTIGKAVALEGERAPSWSGAAREASSL